MKHDADPIYETRPGSPEFRIWWYSHKDRRDIDYTDYLYLLAWDAWQAGQVEAAK